jgi:hypothetical protein
VAPHVVDELDFGFGWMANPAEFMQRCSHAFRDERGRVWLTDVVDVDGLDERVHALGVPSGVIQLLDRHARACAVVAKRLRVDLHVLPDGRVGPFETIGLGRRERALWWPERRTLVCADALGTARYYRAGDERLAVHPFRRLRPPLRLGEVVPEHVVVGHGEGIHERADEAVREALDTARRRAPSWLATGIRAHVRRGRQP